MSDRQNHLLTALNVLSEAVFVYDENMRIKYFNSAAERITGHRREDVIGQKCVALFDKSLCLNNCALCMSTKTGESSRIVHFKSPFIRKDGIERTGEFNAGRLWKSPEGKLEVLVALTDITEIANLKNGREGKHSFRNIIGKSLRMKELFGTIKNIAVFDSTVFIQGESGTGKELVAQAIHQESPRSAHNLVKVNCSAFSDSLLESELFGHVRGAFTGAERDRTSRFEEADGGTIFLDEIGDLSPAIQVKLLRVLQEKEIERVGDNKPRKVDIRIIVATHKNILKEVEAGRFREDLYYRLNVIPIHLPPLRERKEDIPLLCQQFINNWNKKTSKPVSRISDAAHRKLADYNWPGNVRELENAVEHACVKCSKDVLEPEDFPVYLLSNRNASGEKNGKKKQRRNRVTRDMVMQALTQTGNNRTHAADLLDLHRITLWRKMRQWRLA
ncbi:MAG: sigma 54-interacting transcriptional regulator [Nitrospinae bacterium]|nr:sigma 54-interacting transcriptional regulator [Nitrospinota bacterium]